jgi:S-adenosylmethionine:tRNA ribosyltransferase-isomerase
MTINKDHLLSSYDYDLPPELIAQRPCVPRDKSRLLVYNEELDEITHTTFEYINDFLPEDSKLILNQSKVFPCRLIGKKDTGAKIEVFILSTELKNEGYLCLIKSSKKKNIGDQYLFDNGVTGKLTRLVGDGTFIISFNLTIEDVLDKAGSIPIPPYIRSGKSDDQDFDDYQTVFAKEIGSVAAPTAGLHFTDEVFKKLVDKNITQNFVTLHVGLGTFSPVKSESIHDHNMHTEQYFVEKDDWEEILKAKKRFAVGTTSLRVLESLWPQKDSIKPLNLYDTDIFLHPGKKVESISGLITNFHLPGSTLLMLVASLIGREKTLQLYNIAIKERYRFFSYGDAMLIIRKEN